MKQHKVHVGYGFHVNCYHSYRGDANDETGFGGDIRIIRKIIRHLNELNAQGVPVKGTWDFENVYSLERILPEYAPDIIEDVRDRVVKYGDENIIMGYNNGALSAMTEDEFLASINWAVTNEQGSGLVDLFGECAMVVRPQEVMFTPSQAKLYNRAGVDAVCLYYSCCPFDAFRTIVPQLPDEYAFNPVTYTYEGDTMIILPTYCNTDVIDAGSLRYLALDLHEKQVRGEINNDVFIFINMDADSVFWEPFGLPTPLNKLANTMGIRGLAEEVADLDFIVYDTPGNYLKTHKPLASVSFTQDTADGNFDGYASWAEKPFNRQIWTRLERARAFARLAQSDAASPSFQDRVELLSTTHFGLASPVLNVDRERRALDLSDAMVAKELAAQTRRRKLTLRTAGNSCITGAQLGLEQGFAADASAIQVKAKGLETYGVVPMDVYEDGSLKSIYLVCKFTGKEADHAIELTKGKAAQAADTRRVKTGALDWQFCEHGNTLRLSYKGRQIGGKDFLRSYLTYDEQDYRFRNKKIIPLALGGTASGLRIASDIHLPGELEAGRSTLDVFAVDGIDCIFIQMRTKYPYTLEETEISTHASALGRKSDMKWHQAVPMQLRPALGRDVSVVKRNFMDDISTYRVAAFWESVPENDALASFNHHLTGGMVGLSDGETGIILANAVQVLGSMAHCPMRLEQKDRPVVSMNPFGTYYGKQRRHPSRSNEAVLDAYPVIAAQARPLAPSYNGVEENAMMALFGYDGLEPDEATLADIRAFADGAVVLDGENASAHFYGEDNINFKAVQINKLDPKKLKSVISSGVTPGPVKTAEIAVRALSNIVGSQLRAERLKKRLQEK